MEIRKKREFLKEFGPEYVQLKEAEIKMMKGLPHLYGMPWYDWAWDFFTSREKQNFLCAANQISKSSTQIRKCIDWATDKSKWEALWPANPTPNQFWYLYPTANQATIEFEKKWKQFLPGEDFKNHPQYGWREETKNKEIFAVHFNTGVSVYFKSYKQGPEALQTGTVYAVFLDEEVPEDLWDELAFRVSAVDGYIHMVFTATIGQEVWRLTIEPRKGEVEKFPGAWKRQVSMYDCQRYRDGTPSHWTNERIQQVIASCKSDQEVQRRVFGKFVKDEGLKYPQFSVVRHYKKGHPIPPSWLWFMGADIGSGGASGHPSAICVVAVRPDYQEGRVVTSWRGDGEQTTASDVYQKAKEIEEQLKVTFVGKYYDFACADFGQISQRNGGGWIPAEKSHEIGESTINVLFRNSMLIIYDEGDNAKLASELASIPLDGPKRKKKDDLADALRYTVTKINWDWSVVGSYAAKGVAEQKKVQDELKKLTPDQLEVKLRRDEFVNPPKKEEIELEEEFAYWNESYG